MMSELERRVLRAAASAAHIASVTAAIGIVFLAGMFIAFASGAEPTGMMLGWINDVLVLVSYGLAIPVVIAVFLLIRRTRPVRGVLVGLIGSAGLLGLVLLQALLVTGTLTFEQQIGPVSIAFLVVGAWMTSAGWLAGIDGALPRGGRMGLLGATYVGYPIWAFWIGRRLARLAQTRG